MTVHCPGFTKGEAAEEFFAAALVEQLERTNMVGPCYNCLADRACAGAASSCRLGIHVCGV
jgi:hypothetical protein